MKGKALLVLFFIFGVAPWASAQSVLPSSFGGWSVSAPPSQIASRDVGSVASGNADVLNEYGLRGVEKADYAGNGQTATLVLYKMTDPSAAYGAFTFLRGKDFAPITNAGDSAAYAAGSKNAAILVVGNFVLSISSSSARPADAELKTLADGLLPKADKRPYPPLIGFLPAEGLVKGSEVYVLGPKALSQAFPISEQYAPADWIGFRDSAEAIVAHYRLPAQPGQRKGEEAVLLLALYPTQQIAANQYDRMGHFLSLNAEGPSTDGRTDAFGTRSSALIGLLAGVKSHDAASAFLKQVHYATDVTWNEPHQSYSDPSISTIVVGAIVDTGSIMLIALAAGLGFGGLRLVTKFALPGRVFDSKNQVEILQLGLTSKPVKSEDFY